MKCSSTHLLVLYIACWKSRFFTAKSPKRKQNGKKRLCVIPTLIHCSDIPSGSIDICTYISYTFWHILTYHYLTYHYLTYHYHITIISLSITITIIILTYHHLSIYLLLFWLISLTYCPDIDIGLRTFLENRHRLRRHLCLLGLLHPHLGARKSQPGPDRLALGRGGTLHRDTANLGWGWELGQRKEGKSMDSGPRSWKTLMTSHFCVFFFEFLGQIWS